MKKRVGIWIRVSTTAQAKGESPEHHEFRARQYAEVKEWDVIEVYHLEGVSGKEVLKNSEAKRMLYDIKRGHISGLIFSKIARLARNTRELLHIADLFKESNADLISLQESIDTATPSGRFFFSLLSSMATWEREEIASRVSNSARVRAELGKHIGGTAPFGYQYENKKLVLNEKEAEIRKQMYNLFLIHKRKTTVANLLNEKGYRTRKGKKFGYSTIRRLLEDPIAKGLQRVNYSKSMGQGKKWELKPKEEWIFRDAPKIISEEKFEQVQAILKNQMKNNKQPLNKKLQLFTNFVFCSCGGKMFNKPQATPKYVCTKCRSKIESKKLEELFHSQLKNYVTSQKELKNYLSTTTNEIELKETRLKQFKNELVQIEEKMNHLLDLNLKGELPTDGFKHHYNPIFEQSKQIKNEIAKEERKILALKQQEQNSEFIFKEANILFDTWFDLAHEEKRSVIEIITDKIEIGKEDVYIDLNYLIPPNYSSFKNKEDDHRNHKVAVPTCKIRIKSSKPKSDKLRENVVTIGDHIRNKRIEKHLYTSELAQLLKVSTGTLISWELNNKEPSIKHYPKIILFLSYLPIDLNQDLYSRLFVNYRKSFGLTQFEFAEIIHIDQKRISRIEKNNIELSQKMKKRIDLFFKLNTSLIS